MRGNSISTSWPNRSFAKVFEVVVEMLTNTAWAVIASSLQSGCDGFQAVDQPNQAQNGKRAEFNRVAIGAGRMLRQVP